MHDRNKKSTDCLVSSPVLPSFPRYYRTNGSNILTKNAQCVVEMANYGSRWPIFGSKLPILGEQYLVLYRKKLIDCSQGSIDLADKGCQQPTLSSKVADVDPWRWSRYYKKDGWWSSSQVWMRKRCGHHYTVPIRWQLYGIGQYSFVE